MNLAQRLLDLGLAAVAGYVGTKAMEPVSMKLYELEPDSVRKREDAARPGAPFQVAAEKITQALGVTLDKSWLNRASMGLHYGLALSWAPLYPLLRRHARWSPPVTALATGTAMSVVADELMTPAFSGSPHPTSTTRCSPTCAATPPTWCSASRSRPPWRLDGPSPASARHD